MRHVGLLVLTLSLLTAACGGDDDPVVAFAERFCPVAIGADGEVRLASAAYDPDGPPTEALTGAREMVAGVRDVLERLTRALGTIDPPTEADIDDYVADLRDATETARSAVRIAEEGLEDVPAEAIELGALDPSVIDAIIRPLGTSLQLLFASPEPGDDGEVSEGGVLYSAMPDELLQALTDVDTCNGG